MERETWRNNKEFMLSCIGYAVGLGNIWRFPYLCFKSGGGAFFIPYIISLLFGAAPILLLEIGLGQYMKQGGYGVWAICPLFQGISVATAVIVVLTNIYYIVVLAWAAYYLAMSMQYVLPWSHCNNTWNTERCRLTIYKTNGNYSNVTAINDNISAFINQSTKTAAVFVDPTIEFWERNVLEKSDGIDNIGHVKPELAACLLCVWIVVYFCIWRGVRWTGKVVYFTATFPYLILIILLVRGLTLEGAFYGVKYYLIPDFSRLMDAQVWIDGGTQVFFSLAVANSAMITMGSYRETHGNFYRDCWIIAAVNTGTSVLGGFVVFSVLGFMAKQQGVDISEVADSGSGLAFIAYPKAVTQMPFPHLWAILFFIMLFVVGLDTQFVAVEALITTILDLFPKYFYILKGRMIVAAVVCLFCFLAGLPMTTRGGIYIFTLFDYYSASGFVLLWVSFWECIVIGWCFGADRFYDVIEMMIGRRINKFLWICWRYATPVCTMGIILFKIVNFTPVKLGTNYVYPKSGQAFGLCLALASMICIPGVMVLRIVQTEAPSIKKKVQILLKPKLKPEQILKKWKGEAVESVVVESEAFKTYQLKTDAATLL